MAGLRLLQKSVDPTDDDEIDLDNEVIGVLTNDGFEEPLDNGGINELCELLNFADGAYVVRAKEN